MSFFSIIVPVYNKENNLSKCLNSVFSQSYSDWELLIINDGSKDNSKSIINSYSDNRIIYLEHKNRGVSYTRNRGLKQANGDYIVFLDADDFWGDDYLRTIADHISNHVADVYFSGITKNNIDGSVEVLSFPYSGFISHEEFMKTFYEIQRKTHLYGYTTNKILKRLFLLENNLFFNENLRNSEDLDFFLHCYAKCKSFYYIEENGYFYNRYLGGTAIYNSNIDYFSLIDIQIELKNYCQEYMQEEDFEYYAKIIKTLASSAVSQTSIVNISQLSKKVKRINNDIEISKYFEIKENVPFLMIKIIINQLYIKTAKLLYKLCRR